MDFPGKLLSWYDKNKRDLPWRRTKDPYKVWLSEIIMQQTRIGQGTPYYNRFVEAYPCVADLAAAKEEEVLKLWQGLGYYSRARNLHATAKAIMDDHNGIFPSVYSDIRRLKGIGDYTAAAIASICFDHPSPVMDGNVQRFASRYFGIEGSMDSIVTGRELQAILSDHIDQKNPGDFNQAMMEYGAMICIPSRPDCPNCVFRSDCMAYNNNMVEEIPVRKLKPAVSHRYLHYLVLTFTIHGTEFIYLNKRSGNDIWKNLYDFPFVEHAPAGGKDPLPEENFQALLKNAQPQFREASPVYTHILSHQRLHARFYRYHSNSLVELPFIPVLLKDIHRYPVPRLIERHLAESDLPGFENLEGLAPG